MARICACADDRFRSPVQVSFHKDNMLRDGLVFFGFYLMMLLLVVLFIKFVKHQKR
jgi:hypothetical protein